MSVCAEWYYGGLPLWLRDNSSIALRYYDDLWLQPVEEFIRYVTKYVEPYLPRHGGPIVLAQIEVSATLAAQRASRPARLSLTPVSPSAQNEYGNAGDDPKRAAYINWCGNLTESLAIGIPWVMCQQPDAPSPTVYACNGFYCDWYVEHQQNTRKMPAAWTENWPGWYGKHSTLTALVSAPRRQG